MVDVAEYCRELEIHLCRKNDGHLIRIVGPSFETVSRWAASGVPVKVAMGGIDRYFERYYRKGARRRPVKIDFCEDDVLDLFDEWRRATGLTTDDAKRVEATGDAETHTTRKHGPSLPEHLERALIRLSSLRASGGLDDRADTLVDRVSSELDNARARSGGVRGNERRELLERLEQLDSELMELARLTSSADVIAAARQEALDDLGPFRSTMAADAFDGALELAFARTLRERLGLPVLVFR
jgi:hypothetical protein